MYDDGLGIGGKGVCSLLMTVSTEFFFGHG